MADKSDKPPITAVSDGAPTDGNLRNYRVRGEGEGEPVRNSIYQAIDEIAAKSEAAGKQQEPANDESANDKAVLIICEILALMFGLPPGDALFKGEHIGLRMFVFIGLGIFFGFLGPWWPKVRRAFPNLELVKSVGRTASDARYWLAAILLGFFYLAAPVTYRRMVSQPPSIVQPPTTEDMSKATAPIQRQLEEAKRQRDTAISDAANLKEQLEASRQPNAPPPPAVKGPINWDMDGQLFVVGGDAAHTVHAALFRGTSTTSIKIKEAYAISGMTGHRQELKANVPNLGYYEANKVDIPPQARVQLDLTLEPALPLKDFMDLWGKFRIVVVYNGISYEREFDEGYVRKKMREQNPDAFGPRVTPTTDK